MKKVNMQSERLLLCSILSLRNSRECSLFLKDLLTPNEYAMIAQRIQIAHYLSEGLTYSEITERTNASTATISRVNKVLEYGKGGLLSVLENLQV